MHHDELISSATTIVLVRLRAVTEDAPRWKKYTLETIEVIKGAAATSYAYQHFDVTHSENDFAGHTAVEFWQQDIGRSTGRCGPDHAFRQGYVYLFFPDKRGAMKSAEIIRGSDDRWLQYVRSKVRGAPIRGER